MDTLACPSLALFNGQIYLDCAGLPMETVAEIRSSLEVQLTENKFSKRQPPPVRFWRQHNMHIYIPRGLAVDTFHKETRSFQLQRGEPFTMRCAVEPRPFQVQPLKEAVEHLSKYDVHHGQITLCAPCGAGKTFCGLYVASQLQCNVAFISHRTSLLNQATASYNEFYPNHAPAGRVQANECNIQPVTFMSTSTVANLVDRDIEEDIFPPLESLWKSFGLVILDESHHCPAETAKKIMSTIPCPVLFLSATPDFRSDGLGKVVHWMGGRIIRFKGPEVVPKVTVLMHKPQTRRVMKDGRIDNTKTRRELSREHNVNSKVCQEIRRLIENTTHVILLLTDYVEHVGALNDMCSSDIKTKVFRAGEPVDFEPDTRLFIGTHTFAKEGLDISQISMIFLMTPPSRNVEQTLGRLRQPKGERAAAEIIELRTGLLAYKHLENYYKLKRWSVRMKSI